MYEDGNRLSYSINGRTVAITNNMDGTMLTASKITRQPLCTLDRQMLYNHIEAIQTIITRNKAVWFGYKPFTRLSRGATGVTIVECDHYAYRFTVDDKCGEATEQSFHVQRGFDVAKLINSLSYAYSVAMQFDVTLKPKTDVARKIADVGLLTLKTDQHVLVCKESNCCGGLLHNVLLDDGFAETLYIRPSLKNQRCDILNVKFEKLFELPLDQSILTYFPVADAE